MRDRRLTRSEALEEYLVYQIRLFEFLHIFQIILDIKEGRYNPTNPMGHGPNDFVRTVRTMSYGQFSSLMDPQNHALNVFDVWVVLFPQKEKEIVETWRMVEPHIQLVRAYRNDVASHANKNFRRYMETRQTFNEKFDEIIPAMQAFWGLAADLIRNQTKALPGFRNEIEPLLRNALPSHSNEQIEQLKDYFVQNEHVPGN